MKVVRVWWKDTIGGHKQGWRTLKSMVQGEPDECQAVGFLLHEDANKIIIVPNISDDSGDGEIVIPAPWVVRTKVLDDE